MQTIQIPTAMRAAFEQIKVKQSAFTQRGKELAIHINGNISDNVGMKKVPSWQARLSFKMAKILNANGGWNFNPNNVRYAYDNMVLAAGEKKQITRKPEVTTSIP